MLNAQHINIFLRWIDRHSRKIASHTHNVVLQLLFNRSKKKVIFIIGCQRSGTSLMTEIFRADDSCKVYDEFSELSSQMEGHFCEYSSDKTDAKLRLNPLESVKDYIYRNIQPVIVLKPLVETQNIIPLIESFDNSVGLWMFRDYRDVAASYLKRFGTNSGIRDLKPIVDNDQHNWRSEKVPKNVREIVLRYFSENMLPHDAAALFWFVRNSWFFELDLQKNFDILMCRYEDLVSMPVKTMKRIYKSANLNFPAHQVLKEVHSESIGKGATIKLSSEIEKLCSKLLENLDNTYKH